MPDVDRIAGARSARRMQRTTGEPVAQWSANRDPRASRAAEPVVVHIEGEAERLKVALPATVRWQQLGDDGTWAIGCAVTEPVGYEVMGELFLSGILDMG